jgi:hypothetical protein
MTGNDSRESTCRSLRGLNLRLISPVSLSHYRKTSFELSFDGVPDLRRYRDHELSSGKQMELGAAAQSNWHSAANAAYAAPAFEND